MKAFILAAGLGTRLRPLTNEIPKALVKLNGKPLLQILIEKFVSAGITEIAVNVHHRSEKVKTFLKENDFGAKILISDESEKLLDTGGAIKKAAPLLGGEPFVLHNADIISDLDFGELTTFHKKENAAVTLVLRKEVSSRYFLFDNRMFLCGWGNKKTGEEILKKGNREELTEYGFAGVHLISPVVFKAFPENEVFSVVDFYLDICRDFRVKGFAPEFDYWFDLGSIEKLKEAEKKLTVVL